MLRALVWKEWRQLRALRWSGVALGAVLPLAFLAGAEASRRGMSPLGRIAQYSSRDLFGDLLPAVLALALWPLLSLLMTAQAYCGDRAAGTEWFLLERPVPRGRIWLARLVASAASVSVVAAATAVIWLGIAAGSGALAAGMRRPLWLLGLGAVVATLALIAGIAGATLARSPLAAVLLGGLLAALPAGLAMQLAAVFHVVAPVGMVVPWLLVPAYVVASLVASCRGEPAGRGRLERAGITLGAAVALVAATFVVAAPVALRLGHRADWLDVLVPPVGGSGVLATGGWRGKGWLVDLEAARRLRFLPPPIDTIQWKPDGSMVAIATSSGPLGSVRDRGRFEFYDRTGARAAADIDLPEVVVADAVWAQDVLVLITVWLEGHSEEGEIRILDPGRGELRSTGFRVSPSAARLASPGLDGEAYLLLYDERNVPEGNSRLPEGPLAYSLHRIDVSAARVAPEPLLRDEGSIPSRQRGHGKLSRSGRYWIQTRRQPEGWRRVVIDLATGQAIESPQPTSGTVWLADDRLMWVERRATRTRLVTGRPGEAARPLGEWTDADVSLEPSTDGSVVIVRARARSEQRPRKTREPLDEPAPFTEGPVEPGRVPEERVYDVVTGQWLDVELPRPRGTMNESFELVSSWAGPRTLVLREPGVLALVDIDRPDEPRYLSGRPAR